MIVFSCFLIFVCCFCPGSVGNICGRGANQLEGVNHDEYNSWMLLPEFSYHVLPLGGSLEHGNHRKMQFRCDGVRGLLGAFLRNRQNGKPIGHIPQSCGGRAVTDTLPQSQCGHQSRFRPDRPARRQEQLPTPSPTAREKLPIRK